MLKIFVSTAVWMSLLYSSANFAVSQSGASSPVPTKVSFAEIGGYKMYYERHGQGRPLVLLHGGGSTIKSSFENQLAFFSANHEIIAIEQVGHGHTRDFGNEFSYFQMADDTALLLRSLKIMAADFVGWSDGGILALLIARRHPELVRRVVASGANTRLVGMTSEEIKKIQSSTPSQLAEELGNDARDEYISVSPDGAAHWPIVAKKLWDLWLTPVILDSDDLGKISAPVLIISGDSDLIPVEHAVEIFKALPNGKLLVVPGTRHHTFKDAASIVNPIIMSFINAP